MSRPAAIVTGGRRGIGRACAEALADAGYDLLVADLADDPDLRKSIEERGARYIFSWFDLGDLGSYASVIDAAVGGFGRVDCLVNYAGIASPVRGDLL